MLRSIFEESYPGPWPLATVPFGKSIACSTPEAISWDPKWATTSGDISGRAVDVHDSSDGFKIDKDASANGKMKVTASAAASPAQRRARASPLCVLRGAAAMPRFAGLRAAPAPRAAAVRFAPSAARVVA